MLNCPNINTKEWKDLVAAIGEREAFREYMKLGTGEIPIVKKPIPTLSPIPIPEASLFGFEDNNHLEFGIKTLNAVSSFLDEIKVSQRDVPEILAADGSVLKGAIAMINVMNNTIDWSTSTRERILNDSSLSEEERYKRLSIYWSKLPEEAAHWWYKLLKYDSSLKSELWKSHQTALKASELYKGAYGKLPGVNSASDLTEEAIGQLIAEAIKRVEEKNATKEDYSFLKKMLNWINKLIQKFKFKQNDPFELAAMKILASDVSDLMTLEEYNLLTKEDLVQIHDNQFYDESTLQEELAENLKDKDKYVHKLKSVDEIPNIKTFRKKNKKFDIATDKGYKKDDIIYVPLSNGKTGAFVKASGLNDAFKDFYYFLDYKNKVVLNRRTYYFLTDKFEKNTQLGFYTRDKFHIAVKKAAKEGRYIIRRTANPRLSPRIKKQFLDYIEQVNEAIEKSEEIPSVIETKEELLRKYEERTKEELEKEHHRQVEKQKKDSPELRKLAINALFDRANVSDSEREVYEKYLEVFPTLVLINMNLTISSDPFYSYGIFPVNPLDATKPFQDDPFLHDFNADLPVYLGAPSVNAALPEGYDDIIQKVNEEIVSNKFNNKTFLKEEEKQILATIGLGHGILKTKANAIAIEIYKQYGKRKALVWVSNYKSNRKLVKAMLYGKLLEKYPDKAQIINVFDERVRPLYKTYEILQSQIFGYRYLELFDINQPKKDVVLKPVEITQTEDLPNIFYVNIPGLGEGRIENLHTLLYTANQDPNNFSVFEYNPYYDGEYLEYADTIYLDAATTLEYYNKYNLHKHAHNIEQINSAAAGYIYDLARYSPDLQIFNQLTEILAGRGVVPLDNNIILDLVNNDPGAVKSRFIYFYTKILQKDPYILNEINRREETILNTIIERVQSYVTGNTPLDILLDKINAIQDFIKTKNTIIEASNQYASNVPPNTSYIKARFYSPELGHFTASDPNLNLEALATSGMKIEDFNSIIGRYRHVNQTDEITIESETLPEGINFEGYRKVNLPNLKIVPRSIRFSHQLINISIPNVSIESLPLQLQRYIRLENITATLSDFTREYDPLFISTIQREEGEEVVEILNVPKPRTNFLTPAKAAYGFDHIAILKYSQRGFPYYSLGIPGKKFVVEFGAPSTTPFPKEVYTNFRLMHGGKQLEIDLPIGWFGGVLLSDKIYVTEVQADLLQRLFEIATKEKRDELNAKRLAEGKPELMFTTLAKKWTEILENFPTIKSKIDNYYDGWLHIFMGTSLNLLFRNNPQAKFIYVPTSEYYKDKVARNAPSQYYDKMMSVFPSAKKTDDGNFWVLSKEEYFTDLTTKTKKFYDFYMKLVLQGELKDQKELTPDLGSDLYIVLSKIYNLQNYEIFNEYLNSAEGIKHLNELIEWAKETFSDEKPMTDSTTPGGDLVDSEGNVIDAEETEEDKRIAALIKQSYEINKKPKKLDKVDLTKRMDELIDDLKKAIEAGDQEKINMIKKALAEISKEGGGLFALSTEPVSPEDKYFKIPTIDEQKEMKGEEIAVGLAGQISLNTGIPFVVVTPEEALTIDPNYAGQKSFYVNGVTYFLAGKMSMDNVLHEFAHPFVDAIYATNPELFNKLYSDLTSTEEGTALVRDVEALGYVSDRNNPNFRKEVLVRAMTKEAMNNTNNVENSTGFKDFIKKLIFAIKQALRKVFNTKVKIDKLSTNTTLAELADMLKSDKFNIDTELVSEKDYVAYARDVTDFLAALAKVENPEESINPLIHKFFRMMRNQIALIESPKYARAKETVASKKAPTSLEKIAAFLQITPEIDEPQKQFYDEVKILEKNTFNFIHAMLKLDQLLDAVNDHLDVIKDEANPKLVLSDVYYYSIVTRNWEKFIREAEEILVDNGLSLSSEFGRIISSMKSKSEQISRKSIEAYTPGLIEMYMEILAPLGKGIDEFYSSQITKLQKDVVKGNQVAKKELEKLEKKWEEERITESKIRDYLLGNIADTNAVSPWVESYISNPDPITSGFAIWTKNALAEVNFQALKNTNDFVNAVEPLLNAAGYSRTNFVKLMKKISFRDTEMIMNPETGELEPTERKSFLHQFKNMDTFLKKSNYDYEKAIEAGDKELADDILSKRRQHLKDYFHQVYVSEYYDREDVYSTLDKNLDLEDAVYGIMGVDKATATNDQKAEAAAMYKRAAETAYRGRHELLNQIKQEDALSGDDPLREEAIQNKKMLWRDYSRLASLRDHNGVPKFGMDLLSTLIERKYRKESRKFFDYIPIEGEFELALELYEQSLIDEGIKPKTDPSLPDGEFEKKRAKWIKDNTITKIKKEFYENRNRILTNLRNALSKVPKEVRDNTDETIEMEELIDLVTGYRDENGQVIGDDLNDAQVTRIKALQEAVLKKRNFYAGLSGLTKAEMEEFNELSRRKFVAKETLSSLEQQKLDELFAVKNALGVDKALQLEIQKYFRELADIQSKEATDYYVDIVNQWLGQMGQPLVDNETANQLLEPNAYTILFDLNKDFEKWFKNNHILKEKWIPNPTKKGSGETILVYERLFHWNKTVPNDESFYETIELSTGEVIPGIPNRAYYERIVKPEFITDKVVGVTADNRGMFLPKTIAQGAKSDSPYINTEYEALRKSDPAAFAALEEIKKWYLKFQEEMLQGSRLYMHVPRFRNMAVENARAVGTRAKKGGNKLWLGLRNLFVKTDDNYEAGMNFNPDILVNVDMFNDEMHKVPIRGLYNISADETSDNFLDSIIRYMHSGLEQKKLVDNNYFAQTLLSVLKNPKNGIIEAKKFVKWEWIKFKRRVPKRSKKISNRAKNVENFHAREYLGENTAYVLSDKESFWKTKNTVTGLMSLGLFGLNIQSAIKGREATIIQQYIESIGGRYFSMVDYVRGALRAEQMMLENSTQIYATRNRSLNVQIMQIFDPGEEFLSKTISRQMGRSVVSDLAGFDNILMAPRKYLQFTATVKTMCAILYHDQVEQFENGKPRKISYINAFQVKNGTITLKDGIDPDYGPEKVVHTVIPNETAKSIADRYFITVEELLKRAKLEKESDLKEGMEIKVGDSRKFLATRNKVHQVSELIEGVYSRLGRNEMDRSIIGSATKYMKKYFAPMFVNWFGAQRPNAAIGGITMGNYLALWRVLNNIKKFGINGWKWSNAQEIQGFNKSIGQLFMLIFHYWMLGHVFGYDPDDKKRFKRMKVAEKEGMFSKGWWFNSAAAVHYQTMLETETFNIWVVPSGITGGLTKQTIPGPIYFGKTVNKLGEQSAFTMAATNVLKTTIYLAQTLGDEEKAQYQKDEGPYWYQKEGANKVWNIVLGNIFGFTGDQVSPAKAMEKQEEARRRIGF